MKVFFVGEGGGGEKIHSPNSLCSYNNSHTYKLPLVFIQLSKNMVQVFYLLINTSTPVIMLNYKSCCTCNISVLTVLE